MSDTTGIRPREMTAEQRREQLAATVAEILVDWRADNPEATDIPRTVRQEISRAVRHDSNNHRLDTAIARTSVELDILMFQRDAVSNEQRRPGQSATEFGAAQQRLQATLDALERKIHHNPLLSRTDRGHAIEALGRVYVAPRAAVRVDWENTSGLAALKACASERFSAIRLGIAEYSKALAPAFRTAYEHAQQQRAFGAAYDDGQQQRAGTTQRPEGVAGWLSPAHASALRELTDSARRWEQAVSTTRGSDSADADLVGLISEFHDRMTQAQQLGISTERINAELAATHRETEQAQAVQQRKNRFLDSIRGAARGPMTPPQTAASSGSGQRFAFAAPAATGAERSMNNVTPRRTR
jgi:hypothetical protein